MSPTTNADATYPGPEHVQCPYPFFDEARSSTPVWQHPGSGVYYVFEWDDVMTMMRDGDTFQGVNGSISYGGVPMISAAAGAEHQGMRSLALLPFTKSRLRTYESMITAFADQLIDGFIDTGEVELVNQFAIPLPALVICKLMGFDLEGPEFDFVVDRMSMKSADNAEMVQSGNHELGVVRRTTTGGGYGGGGIEVVQEFMKDKLEQRLDHPGDDILTEIARAQIERDGEVDMPYLVTISTELLAGGVVTTAQMMANAMMLALHNPDQMELVLRDRSYVVPMLDEALRVESPVQSQGRIAVRDCVLGGVEIPEGAHLAAVFGSANRDPKRFSDPERFDVTRPPVDLKGHFGFGFGMHFCLGAPLALLEGRIGLGRLFDRITNIRTATEYDVRYIDSTHFRAVREQRLRFDRR
ncbi:MAG TPA: cytochrome P450 [Ilumatobacter sp.]|nr:cytochrome P450 [Ilumatobacter sp.]